MRRCADGRWLACLGLIIGCAPSVDVPGYPLYPASAAPPHDEVARLYGPINSVDSRDVSTMGGAFELLPGCHQLWVRGQPLDSTNYVSVNGTPGAKYFVLRMRPGHAYVIKQVSSGGVGAVSRLAVSIFAEEFDHDGASQGSFNRPNLARSRLATKVATGE